MKLDRGQTTVSADFRNPKDADPCIGREDYHEGSQKVVDSRTSEQTQVEPEKRTICQRWARNLRMSTSFS